jgi:hypothetical protein
LRLTRRSWPATTVEAWGRPPLELNRRLVAFAGPSGTASRAGIAPIRASTYGGLAGGIGLWRMPDRLFFWIMLGFTVLATVLLTIVGP